MERGNNSPVGALVAGQKNLFAAFMGGGAASNGTLATNGTLTSNGGGKYPKALNVGTALTYNSSTGLYLVTYSQLVKHVVWADGIVVDSGGAPTAALKVTVTAIAPATKTITIRVHTPSGTLTDLGTSDMLIMKLEVADTSSIG